ncbi:MAG: acylneuraminate cytidylyltransferase family protein [Candidatus Omnitrophota bacterium]|nr:acylneuraminate cytidylyltransferase family protein [Candidatus Omnitrophota bacterium]
MSKVTAVIPVRGGSERLKNKNLRLIGGESLLCRKIRILKECGNVERIIVNSDSDVMLDTARSRGVEAVKRDPAFASSGAPMNEAIHHVLANTPGEHIIWAQVTSPLLSSARIDEFIGMYFNGLKKGYDSLATYKNVREYLWDDNGPVNYEKGGHPRSQDLKIYKALTFTVAIIGKQLGMKRKYYIGDKPYFVEVTDEEAVDIDNEMDLYIANALLARESLLDIHLSEA